MFNRHFQESAATSILNYKGFRAAALWRLESKKSAVVTPVSK